MPNSEEKPPPKRRTKTKRALLAISMSCCLFFAIISACLLAALVLLGKHLIYNSSPAMRRDLMTVKKAPMQWRLSNTTKPIHYDITLLPNLQTGQFDGMVNITVNVTESTEVIFLHCGKNLNLVTVQLVRANNNLKVFNGSEEVNVVGEFFRVRSGNGEIIARGIYYLYLVFNGNLAERNVGFYRSHYKGVTGEKRFMATSKFEPTYARQAYPCFDEPNLKATYKVHLLKPNDPDYIALSNYPQSSEEVTPNGILVHFNETVPMSTYLSCFIVSDFKHTKTEFDNGGEMIEFRVYASPQQLDKTTYAGHVGKIAIEYYIKYFNLPYPLPKLDMVAIPDFVSGAMEHWGLVTYRETAVLYTNQTHSASNKQRVAEVVAHELAHSWFGNLVTMNWWNDLWLNEGFATYIEYKGVDQVEPDWGMMDQFLIANLHPVLSLDATQGSHPIIQTVTTPDQITEVFDTISYNKGASVLRMLEDIAGENNFQTSVTNYLTKHQYKNAITQDLWDEVQAVVGDKFDVTRFMDTFTVQMGYPLITANKTGTNRYVLTQKRFLKDYESLANQEPSPLNYRWSVPVKYITDKGSSDSVHWFNYEQSELVVEVPSDAQWVKFNPGQIGYYRVNYDEPEWRILMANIQNLSISDRTHLLDETFSLAESGVLNYRIPLDLSFKLNYLTEELDYVPWSVAAKHLEALGKYLHSSQHEQLFKDHVNRILKNAYDYYGWEDDDESYHLKNRARVVILSLACSMDYDEALNESKVRFENWMQDRSKPLSLNLRSIIYKYGMVSADPDTWSKLFDVFVAESDANEKLKLMNGLANVRNPSLLTKFIQLAEDEKYVRRQDYFTLLQYIADNPIGTPIVWDYVREHWSELVARFTLNDRYLGRLIPSITGKFSTQTKLDEMQNFFAKNTEAGAGAAARKQALETVTNNIKWLSQYKKVVEDLIVSY